MPRADHIGRGNHRAVRSCNGAGHRLYAQQSVLRRQSVQLGPFARRRIGPEQISGSERSEEHTSELQSLMRISYAVFCLKKKKTQYHITIHKDLLHNKYHSHYTDKIEL